MDIAKGVGVLVALATLTGCQDAVPAVGWVTASLRGVSDSGVSEFTYEGSGQFRVGRDPGAGVAVAFGLGSRGEGASQGQSFGLYRPGQGRPAPGRYDLAPLQMVNGHLEGFTAHYHRTSAGRAEDFTALSGYVVVLASSDDRLVGDFQVTLVLNCLANEIPGPDDWCTAPTTITRGRPEVKVRGSFVAVPLEMGVAVPDVPTAP